MNKIILNKKPLKTAIICFGARITLSSSNVRSVDLTYLREYLLKVLNRSQVDYIDKKLKKESDIDYYKDASSTDLNDYDEVFIYNASFNLFGGLFKYESLILFEKLYAFEGDIYYFQIDPKLPNLDFAKLIQSKNKDNSYTFKCDNKTIPKYYINPEILNNWSDKIYNKINIAFDGKDYEYFCKTWNSKNKNNDKKLNENISWFELPLAEYYAIHENLDLKLKRYNKTNKYSLVYFGNNRLNERNKIIKDLYNIPEFNKLCIGFNPDITNMDYLPYCDHENLFKIMGEQCLTTVIIGDNLHNGNIKSARFFESMLLDIVAFIYISYDPNKTYIQNPWLKDFIYINNKEELKTKIKMINDDKDLYEKIIKLERDEILNHSEFN